jgi:hypothetical protein
MKKISIGLMLFASLAANAAVNGPLDAVLSESEVQENQTYFDTLGDLFNRGTLPQLNSIKNIAWSGRCFTSNEPSKPINGGYIFRIARDGDVGPLGRNNVHFEASSYWKISEATNYFDSMTVMDVQRAIKNLTFNPVTVRNNSIEIPQSQSETSALRLSGEYLVEEIFSIDQTSDVGPLGPAPERNAGIRCYYFIPEIAR